MAMLNAIEAGHQTALLAPTEILAKQHFQTIEKFTNSLGIRTALLVAGAKTAAKKQVLLRAYYRRD